MKNANEISEESKRVARHIFKKVCAYDKLIEAASECNNFELVDKLCESQDKIREELRSIIF